MRLFIYIIILNCSVLPGAGEVEKPIRVICMFLLFCN